MKNSKAFLISLLVATILGFFTYKTLQQDDNKRYLISKADFIYISDIERNTTFKFKKTEKKKNVKSSNIDYRLYGLAQRMKSFSGQKTIVHDFCVSHKNCVDHFLEEDKFIKERDSQNKISLSILSSIIFSFSFLLLKIQ